MTEEIGGSVSGLDDGHVPAEERADLLARPPDPGEATASFIARVQRAFLLRGLAGDSCVRMDPNQAMLNEYRAALSSRPEDGMLRCAIASALSNLGRYSESDEECAICLRLEPGAWAPTLLMGWNASGRGDFPQAIEHMRDVVALLEGAGPSQDGWPYPRTDKALIGMDAQA